MRRTISSAHVVQTVRHKPPAFKCRARRPESVNIRSVFFTDTATGIDGTFAQVFSDAHGVLGDSFIGGCLDTGASKCVIGRNQARLYCQASRVPYKPSPSSTRFRFGNGVQKSLGTIPVRVPTPIGSVLFRNIDVVAADVPLLLGLDFLDEAGLYVDDTIDKIVCKRDDWSDKLTRRSGHIMWGVGVSRSYIYARRTRQTTQKLLPPIRAEALQPYPPLPSG